jgi:hypothetical protein
MNDKNQLVALGATLLLACCFPIQLVAQSGSLQGFVTDAGGRFLEGATVTLEADALPGRRTVSDRNGFFQIGEVIPSSYQLTIRHFGYLLHQEEIEIGDGRRVTLTVRLEVAPVVLDEVVVLPAAGAARRTLGRQLVTASDLRLVPTPAGSGDLANYLQTLPGVVTTGDRGGQMFIRGGTHTENLALIDGLVIYQPFHILGFFSVFPEDLVSSVDFYAGGFGARYSGRSSSVLDVQIRDGDRERVRGSGSISPFIAEAHAEGPLVPGGNVTWLASARRSVLEEASPHFLREAQPLGFESQLLKLSAWGADDSRCSALGLRTSDRGRLGSSPPVRSSRSWRS